MLPIRHALAWAACVVFSYAAPVEPIIFNDDGGWNWLQDERAVVAGETLVIASVAMGSADPNRAGHIEVATYNFRTRQIGRFTLHEETTPEARKLWRDDHSCPALALRPDGRIVALYNRHGKDEKFYYRITTRPNDASAWSEERGLVLPTGSRAAFPTLQVLPTQGGAAPRMLAFFRGLHNRSMPSWAESPDGGETWEARNVFIQLAERITPYVKYAGDARGAIHLVFTDGHRVNFHNGVYHAIWRDGRLLRADGAAIASTSEGLKSVAEATEVFRCNPDSVAMISDLALDREGRPHVVYSVQLDTRPQRPRPVGADHRYRYARWTGRQWQDFEIAHAGTETHAVADDDCTGLIALDPGNVNVVYISTNADPKSGAPLISRADQKRHWEIFRGVTADGGATWAWTALTCDSTADNLRPIVPARASGPAPVIWLRGEMRMPNDFTLAVVGVVPAGR